MACACKAARQADTMLFGNKLNEKKGVKGFFMKFSINFLNKLITTLLIILLTPIVLLLMLYNFLIGDKLVIRVPKFITKRMNKNKNE